MIYANDVEQDPASAKHSTHGAIVAAFAVASSLLAQDWIAGLAVLVLYAIWHYLRDLAEPPVLALALTTQWLQINCAIVYEAAFGRRIDAMDITDYRPMVLIGLGCVLSILVGLRIGLKWGRKHYGSAVRTDEQTFPLATLMPLYIVSFPVIGIVQAAAWDIEALTQPILALSLFRNVLVFLILRKLVYPEFRAGWFVLILTGEILLGFSGFFAGFREPLFFAALALLERFEIKRFAHWLAMAFIVAVTIVMSLLWTGIKQDYREQYSDLGESAFAKLSAVADLVSPWFKSDSDTILGDVDKLVDRMWPIYIPALAVNRAMASDRPPLNGELLGTALAHVLMPRIFFPNKPMLKSDSEMVREFTGLMVAGEESDTSIAFGYAPELFLDLGVPIMFLPIVLYGCIIGYGYAWILRTIRNRDLAIAIVTVIFWLMLYLFERSLAKTFGLAGTLMFYIGGGGVLIDRYLGSRRSSL
jgi:hypothetical protein